MSSIATTEQPKTAAFDVEAVRADFPALGLVAHGHPLAYLDNAATSQKPRQVLEVLDRTYRESNANVHRGVHLLAERATLGYEAAREKLARYLGAAEPAEIVFTRGTTESINLVAQAFARPRLAAGDEVLITHLEHHSNIVPWQLVCEATGARLRVAPIDDRGEVDVEAFAGLLGERTKIAAFAYISNSLGTVNPVRQMVELAHQRGVPVLIDGAQAVPHRRVDLQELGCDFFAFSGHKAFGPTGIGALYGKREHLEAMPPFQGGGEMIRTVSFEKTEFAPPPARFEAGTPNFVGAIGLGAGIDYLDALDLDRTAEYERELLAYATGRLRSVPGVRLVGTAREKAGVLAFTVDGIHPHDIGTVLDREGVAVRAGHHCAQPVMERFGVASTVRASFAFYNTVEEADRLVAGVRRAQELFGA